MASTHTQLVITEALGAPMVRSRRSSNDIEASDHRFMVRNFECRYGKPMQHGVQYLTIFHPQHFEDTIPLETHDEV